MTLNRLLIVIGVVVLLVTGGVVWLWEYAYTPEGRARTIFTQIRGDTTSPRGWLIEHGLIRKEIDSRPTFVAEIPYNPPGDTTDWWVLNKQPVLDRLAELGPRAFPVIMEESVGPG